MCHSVQKVRTPPPSMDNLPYMAIPPFLYFSLNPLLLARLFQQYDPIEILDKHKNKLM